MVSLQPELAHRLGRIGRIWIVVAVTVFAALGLTLGVPLDPEGGSIGPAYAEPLQYGLLGVEVIALLLSWRWKAIEALLLALGGAALSVLAAYEYRPEFAILIVVAFLVPAVLLWLAWHPKESLGAVLSLAVATATVLGVSWLGATYAYAEAFGPTHPQSSTPAIDDSLVDWMWSGAVNGDGFTVVVGGDADALTAVGADDPAGFDSADAVTVGPTKADDHAAVFTVAGLQPDTEYRYVAVVDGELDLARVGTTNTFPTGPANVTFAVASCATTGSNGKVFDEIRAHQPDLFIMTGDFHYRNITRNSLSRFRGAYETQLEQPAQAALYQEVPIAYVWDDHDFGGDNSDASANSAPTARLAYESYVPHYELGTETINQAFTIGRVRFVVTDTRAAREPGTMLGSEQLAWLEAELLATSANRGLVVWVNPTPWLSSEGEDTWAAFDDERRRIADFIELHDVNVVMVSGDAHMVAIDDGSNNRFSTSGEPGFPIFHAAPLDRPGSVKGGPYSHGVSTDSGQFGLVTISDDGGDTISVTFIGMNYTGQELMRHTFEVAVAAAM